MYQRFTSLQKLQYVVFCIFSLQDLKDICTFAPGNQKLPIEGQDEDADDFPSAKVHRRCKKTKSPILVRSKPVVKPLLQWALNGRTDYDRQTFISLLLHYLQNKLIQTENKIMYLPTCIEYGSNLSICQSVKGGISCSKHRITG